LAQAERQLQSAEWDYAQTSSTVRQQLRQAFVELQMTQTLIELTQSIAERRAQNVKLVQLRYEAGREHRGSLLLAQAQSAQSDLDLKQAQRSLSLAQYRMGQILGRTEYETLSLQDQLAEPVNANLTLPDYPALAKKTPLVLKWQAQLEAAQLAVNSAYGSYYPSLDADASWGRTDQDFPPQRDQWSLGVSLSWPLFTGGKRWAAVASAEAQVRLVSAQAIANYQTVYLNLMQSWVDFQNARDQLDVEKKFLDAAQERSRISEAQYATGLLTFDNWTIIEDDFVQTRKTYLLDQTQALEKEAAWIQARGGLLEDEH
jgi:outer membrane protein TolC